MYTKKITIDAFNMVHAEVFDGNRTVGLKFFRSTFIDCAKKNFKKAHKWADARIKLCEEYEVVKH